eukprot:sb/3470161/
MQKAEVAKQRVSVFAGSPRLNTNNPENQPRKVSVVSFLGKKPLTPNTNYVSAQSNAIRRKLKTATLLSVLFASNYILCYLLDVLYYALPVVYFTNIKQAINWMTQCNPTSSLYLRFWYYYSVALSSLLNALIHLAVNDIVKDHIAQVVNFSQKWWGRRRGGGSHATGGSGTTGADNGRHVTLSVVGRQRSPLETYNVSTTRTNLDVTKAVV